MKAFFARALRATMPVNLINLN